MYLTSDDNDYRRHPRKWMSKRYRLIARRRYEKYALLLKLAPLEYSLSKATTKDRRKLRKAFLIVRLITALSAK